MGRPRKLDTGNPATLIVDARSDVVMTEVKALKEACEWIRVLREQLGFEKLTVADIEAVCRKRVK